MPNTSGSAKKNSNSDAAPSTSPLKSNNKSNASSHNRSENSASSAASKTSSKPRKRKRREMLNLKSSESELESELEDCNLEDAIALERKLRKVAKSNSLNHDEMKKLLQKFVKNEHVLALVTLKAEDELAREKRELEQRAIIITDTPSVPKLTRAKARELNKTPAITLPALSEPPQPEIAALIKEDLHSDEDDGEYIFKEEDFVSDDDPNTTASDFDSNPCTPQTPLTQNEYEDSPVKLTSDGCFKIPLDKREQTQENMRIAARTRSKLCLQETTIEDIQSEFVPPDVDINENHDIDATANDEDWMQFLNDFSKPLNNSLLGDDDDPVNDPEYIAADKERVDAEELRDVNISKKELTELVAELFEGLVNEGVSLESIDLETPQKFLENSMQLQMDRQITPTTAVSNSRFAEVSRQIDFDVQQSSTTSQPICVSDATISSSNITQTECPFQPDVMSTPAFENRTNATLIPVAITTVNETNSKTISIPDATTAPELIAIPVAGQPNHYHLARVLATQDQLSNTEVVLQSPQKLLDISNKTSDNRYTVPYDNNFTWQYISIKRHVYSEYMEKFENLRNIQDVTNNIPGDSTETIGFTAYQHDLLQQQLRMHVQMLTQTYLQTYSHPEFWKMAPQVRAMLDELHEKSATHATFNAWNLKGAIVLINRWEQELAADTPENKEMMAFLHREIELTNRNTRQIPRFAPRIMDFILNSNVFMYPSHLPRIAFTPKVGPYEMFAPSESMLIALGLDKHMRRIRESEYNISKKMDPLVLACKYMCKDTVFGKSKRRIWDQVKKLRNASYYNPIKYYFEHNCAPPVEQELITFENNTVPPPIQRVDELPLAWQNYVQKKNQQTEEVVKAANKNTKNTNAPRNNVKNSNTTNCSYLDIVREAVGENIQLPDILLEAAQTSNSTCDVNNVSGKSNRTSGKKAGKRSSRPNNVTINVNYVFGVGAHQRDVSSLINSTTTCTTPSEAPQIDLISQPSNIIAYNYDYNLQQLEPVVDNIESLASTAVDINSSTQQNCPEPAAPIKSPPVIKARAIPRIRKNGLRTFNHVSHFGVSRKRHRSVLVHRRRRAFRKRFIQLLTTYRHRLQQQELPYIHSAWLLRYYKYFKALELYTELLDDLKMFCRNTTQTHANSCSGSSKRVRSEDETCNNTTARSRKINRQEENLRNMLLPDSAEDANRKDAIYAFNFYEKVEEVFKSANRADDYEKFNCILKSFNPKTDRAADLYHKLEALFLPDYPELAQVFLTFLMPSEAAEIGKFFEHFMITNMTTFINKLNVYFNKQPAQIRKIYNCLSELAEDSDVTMKKIEEKILPLLKGNQFLVDWFMQQFPEAPVPERLLPAPEHVNLKEVQNNQNGEFMETMKDIMDSPNSDQQPQCQLRYINGRIFYGSKMTLPAKLSFMAKKYTIKDENSPTIDTVSFSGCLHGIKEYGEQRLAAAAAATATNNTSTNIIVSHNDGVGDDTNDKSEEDELSKALVIDTTVTGGEEDSCSSIEACDDVTLRSHALRLNPNYYGNSCFTAVTATSTPNIGNIHQAHHPNAKKHSLNFYDDIKMSPRKHVTNSLGISLLPPENIGSNSTSLREKRKSPTKKIRSPNAATKSRTTSMQHQPMVVIHHEHNTGPIAYAKKLKTLIDSSDEQTISHSEQQINKIPEPIIARVKERPTLANVDQTSRIIKIDSDDSHFLGKYENSDDMEFLPEHTPPRKKGAPQRMGFPRLQITVDSSTEECSSSEPHLQPSRKFNLEADTTQKRNFNDAFNTVSSTNVDSDEDCKLDIVATLATTVNDHQNSNSTTTTAVTAATIPLPIATNAFTRDEDKIILIEMKIGSNDRNDLLERISTKLPNRTLTEISTRHQFLMDFLSKLQGKH